MTVDVFIARAGNSRRQLVDGEPRPVATGSMTHGVTQANVAYTLTRHLRDASGPRAHRRTLSVPRRARVAARCGSLHLMPVQGGSRS
jgi:hypothetical protein